MQVYTITDPVRWNTSLRSLPQAHILQSWEWGEFKRATTGWQPLRLAFQQGDETVAMASVGMRSIGPLHVMYAPRGPALTYDDADLREAVLDHLQELARQYRAVWLKIDPDVIAATGVPGEDDDTPHTTGQGLIRSLEAHSWRFSGDQVQFRNSIHIDLTRSEDEILMAMSSNTRRKVRTAEKKEVSIREAGPADLDTLYDLYSVTGNRDDFLIRSLSYYRQAWQTFMEVGLAHALIAEHAGKAIAHVILFHFGRTCWYFYGASANEERQRMPNYALQWEAMRWAKAQGYAVYDMWGAPDVFDESDSMWGVYEFKRGFRGTVVRTVGAWDYAPYTALYRAYTGAWPRVRAIMKRRA